jgi:adenylosuccinate lyase
MFGLSEEDVARLTDPADYTGRSAQQVTEFISEYIKPIIEENRDYLGREIELSV